MRRVEKDGIVFYQFQQWVGEKNGPVHGIFTRIGGVSNSPWASLNVGSTVGDDPEAVATNRHLMLAALDLTDRVECTVWQVHGAETVVVDDVPQERVLGQADGLVTARLDVALTMRFADCVPILLYDARQGVIGMAHAGWRGTLAGAAVSVVRAMQDRFGCRAADIEAGIGPSIGPEHYQVGSEVVEAFYAAFDFADAVVRLGANGSAYLDLWEANRRALQAVGVEQIEVAGISTAASLLEFYSHRAEQGRTGRFGAVMALSHGR